MKNHPVIQCDKTLKEVYDEFLEIGSTEFQYNTIYNTKKLFIIGMGKVPLSI